MTFRPNYNPVCNVSSQMFRPSNAHGFIKRPCILLLRASIMPLNISDASLMTFKNYRLHKYFPGMDLFLETLHWLSTYQQWVEERSKFREHTEYLLRVLNNFILTSLLSNLAQDGCIHVTRVTVHRGNTFTRLIFRINTFLNQLLFFSCCLWLCRTHMSNSHSLI